MDSKTTQSRVCHCVTERESKKVDTGTWKWHRCTMPTGPVISESLPDGFAHAQTTHTYTRSIQQGWVGARKVLVPYLTGIQHCKHARAHTLGIRCTWTDWHVSKTCTIPVIYPTQTHTYQHILTAVWPGVMPCGLVSPDRHIKIRHTSVLQFQASDGMAR